MKTHLEAKVIATNRANAEANCLFPLLVAALTPFLNTQIFLIGGGLRSKVREAIHPIILGSSAFQVLPDHRYDLKYIVKECEGYGNHFCDYAEAHLYVGYVRELLLVKLHTPPNFKTDITANQIREARQHVIKARSELNHAQSALGNFGEYDS